MSSKIHIDNASITKAYISKIQAKLKAYHVKNSKVGAIIGAACANKTLALELIHNIYNYNGTNEAKTLALMSSLLTAIKIDQKHDFNDEGNRCSGGIDVDFIPYSLGAIEKDLKSNFIDPSNSKVELITSQTELSGLTYYCMDIGVRDGNAKKLEDDIVKAQKAIVGVSCCAKISTIAQIIDSAGCAYNAYDKNSYDPTECKFCDNEMTMYNIGFILYQAFFEYFRNNDEYYLFEYIDTGVGTDLEKKEMLAKKDATQKRLNIALYNTSSPKKPVVSSSCVIGQKGFSVSGICTFLKNDKGMFDKPFVEYIIKNLSNAGNKAAQKQFKTTTCMCIKGYGDFGQLIITSYLNCLPVYLNNMILLTCDRFLVNIACILECPFMLGTNIYPCYLYDTTAKIANKHIIDVWNMSSKNIKIICDRLHNPSATAAAATKQSSYILDRNIAALITAQQNHITAKQSQIAPTTTVVKKKPYSGNLLKVEAILKNFNEEENRLYMLHRDDYAIIYNSGGSGKPFYGLYDISGVSSSDVDTFFKNPLVNISGSSGGGSSGVKLILNDPRFLNISSTIITTEKYTNKQAITINQMRKSVEATGVYYNNFINIKVFVESLKDKQPLLREYTTGSGANSFITKLKTFAIFEYSQLSNSWGNLGYTVKGAGTLEDEFNTKKGYLAILEHWKNNVKSSELENFNKFLRNKYKSKACSKSLDYYETLLENIADLCNLYINELNAININLEYIKDIKKAAAAAAGAGASASIYYDTAIFDEFYNKIKAYYNTIKDDFKRLIDDVKECLGNNLVVNTKPCYVLEYYVNLIENPTADMFNLYSGADVKAAEALFRVAFKATYSDEQKTLGILKSIIEFIENINNINNFVEKNVVAYKGDLIDRIDKHIADLSGISGISGGGGSGSSGSSGSKSSSSGSRGSSRSRGSSSSNKPIIRGDNEQYYIDSYDTVLTQLRDKRIDDSCYINESCDSSGSSGSSGSSSTDINRIANDKMISELKYNEYLQELSIILGYLYGSDISARGDELTLWNVFCYYYYTKIDASIRSIYPIRQLIEELKKDVSIWETFKRHYPIYQYIIEYYYFKNSQGLLYKFIRGEQGDSVANLSSGDTLMVVERYNKFIEMENKVEYHIKDYNRYEREQVEELTRMMEPRDTGILYGIIDLQKMLDRRSITRELFGKSKNYLKLQALYIQGMSHYYANDTDRNAREKYELNKLSVDVIYNLELFKRALEHNTLSLTPNIIEHLSRDIFTKIIRTHLSYIDPRLIYYFSAEKLSIFLKNAPLNTEEFRDYMLNANIETIDTIIQGGNFDIISKLPFYHFEPLIIKYNGYFENLTAEKVASSLTPDQLTQFIFANRQYIRYASTSNASRNPIGKLITEDIVLGVLNFDPSCIEFLSLEYTQFIFENHSKLIKGNDAFISYLSNVQLQYIIDDIQKQRARFKYILIYMPVAKIINCITNGIIKVGSSSSGSGGDKTIIQEFKPDQLIHIINYNGNGNDNDNDKFMNYRVGLINLLSYPTQLLILQIDPRLIVKFTPEQMNALIEKGYITMNQITGVLIENGEYLLNKITDKELINYANAEPSIYNLLSVKRLVNIYSILKVPVNGGDAAVLKLLYYISPEKKGWFLVECPEIIVKYQTYIQYLNVEHLYSLFKRYVDANVKLVYSDFLKVLALLSNKKGMLEMYDKYKIYIPYMTEEQIIYIISKRWILDIPITETEEGRINEVSVLCDKYIPRLFEGITGEQALTLKILDPRHNARNDINHRSNPLNSNNDYYSPLKFIDYIRMLSEDARSYFIKNLGRDEKQKRQLKEILDGNKGFIGLCSTTQLIEYLRYLAPANIANEIIEGLSDEHIETIITFSSSNTAAYINHLSQEQLYRFINKNKDYINTLTVVRQYEVIRNDPSIISHLSPEKVLGILKEIRRDNNGNVGSYMKHLGAGQLRYLIMNGSITEDDVKKNGDYQKKLFDNALEQLQREPEYILNEPEYLKKIYLGLLSDASDASILYEAIVKYDEQFLNSLDNEEVARFLEYNPEYIKRLLLEKQLHFIEENWMYLEYFSLTSLKELLIQRGKTYELIHRNNYKTHSDANSDTFDLLKFILEYNCNYKEYKAGLADKKRVIFDNKYRAMATINAFNMNSGYYEALRKTEDRNYNKIKGHLEAIRKDEARSVGRWDTPTLRKYTNNFRDDIFYTLPILTNIKHIEEILSLITDRDLENYIKVYSGYINYLPLEKILSILKEKPEYIKYLDYDKIPSNIDGKLAKHMTKEQIASYNTRNTKQLTYSPRRSPKSPRSPTIVKMNSSGLSPRTPKKASQSPRKASQSPRKASQSPRKAPQSPRKASQSPKKSPQSPKEQALTLEDIEENPDNIFSLTPEKVSQAVAKKVYDIVKAEKGAIEMLPKELRSPFFKHLSDDEILNLIKEYPRSIYFITPEKISRVVANKIYETAIKKGLITKLPKGLIDRLKDEPITELPEEIISRLFKHLSNDKIIGFIKEYPRSISLFKPKELSSEEATEIYNIIKANEGIGLPEELTTQLLDYLSAEEAVSFINENPHSISLLTPNQLSNLLSSSYNNERALYNIIIKNKEYIRDDIKRVLTRYNPQYLQQPDTQDAPTFTFAAAPSREMYKGGNLSIYKNTGVKKVILGKERGIYKIPKSNKEYIRYKGSYIYVKEYIGLFAKAAKAANAAKPKGLKEAKK